MASPAAPASAKAQSFTFYAKATHAQFINHADDRARGNKANPFNAEALATPPKANKGKKGARAGDNALFSLNVYSNAALTKLVGTATYSCTFNFAQEAICEADFELNRGTMIAMGPAKLDGTPIVLAVTGGTGRYAGAHGQVTSTGSSTKTGSQVLFFQLG